LLANLSKVLQVFSMLIKDFYILLIRLFLGYIFFSSSLCKLSQGQFGQIIGPCNLETELAPYKLGLLAITIAISQLIIGILLFAQRYALLGAIMAVPMNICILAITLSQGWLGTPVIDAFLLFLTLLLLLYDYPKLKFLILPQAEYLVRENILDQSFVNMKWQYLGIIAGIAAGISSRYNNVLMMSMASLAFACFLISLLSYPIFSNLEKLILIAIFSAMLTISYASLTGMPYFLLTLILSIFILLPALTIKKIFFYQK
jgi:uncharacterized membrane protein YphA (DoxX/SURF4 family)